MVLPDFIYINGLPVLRDISGSMNPDTTTAELVALVDLLAEKLEGKTEDEILAHLIAARTA